MSKKDNSLTPPKALNDTTQGTSISEEKNPSIANITATTMHEQQQSQKGQELKFKNDEDLNENFRK